MPAAQTLAVGYAATLPLCPSASSPILAPEPSARFMTRRVAPAALGLAAAPGNRQIARRVRLELGQAHGRCVERANNQ